MTLRELKDQLDEYDNSYDNLDVKLFTPIDEYKLDEIQYTKFEIMLINKDGE